MLLSSGSHFDNPSTKTSQTRGNAHSSQRTKIGRKQNVHPRRYIHGADFVLTSRQGSRTASRPHDGEASVLSMVWSHLAKYIAPNFLRSCKYLHAWITLWVLPDPRSPTTVTHATEPRSSGHKSFWRAAQKKTRGIRRRVHVSALCLNSRPLVCFWLPIT